jgi:citrate lyase subunit beta/citryl-CoA lyase
MKLWTGGIAHRSLMFIPSHLPKMLAKAMGFIDPKYQSEGPRPDIIILDLEDSVPEDKKVAAQENVVAFLENVINMGQQGRPIVVRINALDKGGTEDLEAIRPFKNIHAVILSKTEAAWQLKQVTKHMPPSAFLWPFIETPLSIMNLRDIIEAKASLGALLFGSQDMRADTGIPSSEADRPNPTTDTQKALIINAARTEGLMVFGGVCPQFRGAGLEIANRSARRDYRAGFDGKLCIHPDQIPGIHKAFSPAAKEIEIANLVVAEAGDGGIGAIKVVIDGEPRMIERLHVKSYQETLAMAMAIARNERALSCLDDAR